jgi:hypothetical protein
MVFVQFQYLWQFAFTDNPTVWYYTEFRFRYIASAFRHCGVSWLPCAVYYKFRLRSQIYLRFAVQIELSFWVLAGRFLCIAIIVNCDVLCCVYESWL